MKLYTESLDVLVVECDEYVTEARNKNFVLDEECILDGYYNQRLQGEQHSDFKVSIFTKVRTNDANNNSL